jgi:multidrug efflux pump subunit AcrA (membrane-fusion protein)
MSDESTISQSDREQEISALPKLPQVSTWKQRIQTRRWGVVSLGFMLLSGFAITIPRFINARADTNSVEQRVLAVKTVQIEPVKSYPVTRTYTGEVTATRASELGFERSGKLIWLGTDQGNLVKAGEPIAKLDTQNLAAQRQQLLAQKAQAMAVLQELQNGPRSEDIAVARAEVGDLQDQLALEKLKRDRREYLYREGAISKEQLDETAFSQGSLSDRLAAAQSRLSELKAGTRPEQIAAQQAAVQQLEASIADLEITIVKSTITAPFTGIVAERRLDEGTVVNAGQSIVRLVEAVNPEVEIGVPAEVANRLAVGSQQRIKIGQKTYSATVISTKPEVNSTTRTRTIVLKLNSSAQQFVAPKQVARLEVTQIVPTDGYWLPTTALVRGERGLWSCYAVVETEQKPESAQKKTYRVERRDVEVLYTTGDGSDTNTLRALVRGTLRSQDRIIVDGVQRIVPGQLIQPIGL